MSTTTEITNDVAEITTELTKINEGDKLTLKLLADKINAIIDHLQSSGTTTTRDRGPKSEKEMTEDDARRISLGDLEKVAHMECAKLLGLSYGQVYSARKGYTFKAIYKEVRDRDAAAAKAAVVAE